MKTKFLETQSAKLLRKEGKSLGQIARMLNVSKSSVSLWCRDINLSHEQKLSLLSRNNSPNRGAMANRSKRLKELELIRQISLKEIVKIDKLDLERIKDIGTALYWAEGTKRGNAIDFTNSNPQMVKLIMVYFKEVIGIPNHRFRVNIYYHSGQNEQEMKNYWSKITQVPLDQFRKSIFKQEGTGQRKNILYNGTCKIRVCSRDLHYKILTWIEQFHLE